MKVFYNEVLHYAKEYHGLYRTSNEESTRE